MPAKIYDNTHQCFRIRNWKKYGLICREGETYKDIYYHVMSINNCELCNVEFTDEIKNQRCMDHDHHTGYFRKVLCRKCNANYLTATQKLKITNKTGHMWISPCITKNKSGNISVGFRYCRKIGDKRIRKASQSITKLIALSFINLLKKPI